MATRPLALLALLSVALLAGCVERTADPAASASTTAAPMAPAPEAPEEPSPATQNLTQEPVRIDEYGDMSQGASKEWTWHVAPGFTEFQVELFLEGPQGSPQAAATELSILLDGGDPRKERHRESATVSSYSAGCRVCYDGNAAPNQAGPWRLMLESGPSVATYRVLITVTY